MPDATPERWKRVEEVYQAALQCSPAERDALLERTEPDIRREVEALLERDDPAAVTVTQVGADQKFGHYKIEARIGAGGMGEVFRAVDTRLGRKVAIKVTSEQFGARFEREARVISALNHPNICTLYDVGPNYLVMELVEGETLAARLKQGALSPDATLRYAEQIGSALAEAHAKDIIHRDLKPANIMVTKNGVKVLDFGLAKFIRAAGAAEESEPLTASAMIVGTVPYMAPEQLEGKPGDVRTDIFSLGLVLCEMVTGKRVFTGASQAAIIGEVLKCQMPPLENTPETLAKVIQGCLNKDPEQRWQSAREFLIALRFASGGKMLAASEEPALPARNREWLAWGVAGVLGLATIGLGVSRFTSAPASQEQISFQIPPPVGGTFSADAAERDIMAVSPDGLRLAISVNVAGKFQIWIRKRDELSARPLPGTEGGTAPFWSPDSRSVAFFAEGKLKRIDLAGGPPRTICDISATVRTGTWSSGNDLLFSDYGEQQTGLFQVSAEGGTPRVVAQPNAGRNERMLNWPVFLPDGKHFLYMAWDRNRQHKVFAGSLAGGEPKLILQVNSKAEYAPSGYLLFVREGTLLAQRFDPDSLQLAGSPVAIAENIEFFPPSGMAAFSVSAGGALAYQSNGKASTVVWMDRTGHELGTIMETAAYQDLRLSPDGKKAAIEKDDERLGTSDVYVTDLASGNSTRITSDAGNEFAPVWSPDGRRLVYGWDHNAPPYLHEIDLETGGAPEAINKPSDGPHVPFAWLTDGSIVYSGLSAETNSDLLLLPPGKGVREPRKLLASRFNEDLPAVSPDTHWIAYVSDDTGRQEVYVRTFPQMGGPRRISNAGGTFPRWARDGRELFYIEDGDRLKAVSTKLTPEFQAGNPTLLFQQTQGIVDFDPAPDGRFAVNVGHASYRRAPINVIVNWTAKINER